MSQSLTLYNLSAELIELMNRYDDAETDAEREPIKLELQAFAEAHVRKVDNVRSYLRHCEMMVASAREEQARQKQHADAWQGRYDRLKEVCKYVMQTFQAKRFDGNTGSLLLKGNGGKQAVTITDEALIPDEFCVYEGALPGFIWLPLIKLLESGDVGPAGDELLHDIRGLHLKRVPKLSLIEAELQKPCEACAGTGTITNPARISSIALDDGAFAESCLACGGSGKRGVPGARLEPRGEHLEVK